MTDLPLAICRHQVLVGTCAPLSEMFTSEQASYIVHCCCIKLSVKNFRFSCATEIHDMYKYIKKRCAHACIVTTHVLKA